MNIQGSMVAIATPMHADESIDYTAFKQLIDWQIEQGTNSILVAGTTGESATIDVQEHCKLIEQAVLHVNKRVPVIAGTGGNSTLEAIELTSYAKKVGADASLQVVPYYNKPTQEGMYLHYKKIAETVDIPVILYNVPSRTVADMHNDTAMRLADLPNIIGIKDATGDLCRGSDLINKANIFNSKYNRDFKVYSGDDATAALLMLAGAKGNISVTANILPKKVQQIAHLAINKNNKADMDLAILEHLRLIDINNLLFCEANPIAVKYCLYKMGKINNIIRLPLTPLADKFMHILDEQMQKLGLI
jgi:4-hydroxy-tetrahydrodipicolinate synthase